MVSMRGVLTLLVGGALALGLAGCATGDDDEVSGGPVSGDAAGPVVLTYPRVGNSVMQALFAGTLGIENDCLYGRYAEDGNPDGDLFGLVFPEGTELSADQKSIRLPDGKEFALGDYVEFGGGGSSVTPSGAEVCPAGSDFLVQTW